MKNQRAVFTRLLCCSKQIKAAVLCYGSDDQDDGEDEWFHIRMKYINVYVE